MARCEKCEEWNFYKDNICKCKPFSINDHEGEEHVVYAAYEEDAALKFAEKYNIEGDYSLIDESVEIDVNGTIYKISAEHDIHYRADKIT